MPRRIRLTRNSKLIIADLFRAKRPLSIKKIAERNGIAWKTANENIKRLERRFIVKCDRTRRKTSCKLTKRAIEDLK